MEWCRLTIVEETGTRPGISMVDQIARLALTVQRAGGRLIIEALCDDLAELLELSGLGVEVQWKAERREKPLRSHGRQEDRQLGDPPI